MHINAQEVAEPVRHEHGSQVGLDHGINATAQDADAGQLLQVDAVSQAVHVRPPDPCGSKGGCNELWRLAVWLGLPEGRFGGPTKPLHGLRWEGQYQVVRVPCPGQLSRPGFPCSNLGPQDPSSLPIVLSGIGSCHPQPGAQPTTCPPSASAGLLGPGEPGKIPEHQEEESVCPQQMRGSLSEPQTNPCTPLSAAESPLEPLWGAEVFGLKAHLARPRGLAGRGLRPHPLQAGADHLHGSPDIQAPDC